jgi:hypothetical protein
MRRITAVARIAGKNRGIAKIFAAAPTIRAVPAGFTEPRDPDAQTGRKRLNPSPNQIDAANNLMPKNERKLGVS